MSNRGLKEFWAGYRNARIAAYLMLNENKELLTSALSQDNRSEQYVNGFISGMERISSELMELLAQERAYQDDDS